MPESAALQQALAYAKLGWHVAPANINYLPNGKKQVDFLVPWGTEATADEATIRRWWTEHPYAGVVIVTKPSKLVVIDLDVDEAKSVDGIGAWIELLGPHLGQGGWLDTYTVATPRGGTHLYFADPDNRAVNSSSKLAPGIDVRGGGSSFGGVVFAPPTNTAKGSYVVVSDMEPQPLPEWLWALIEKPKVSLPELRAVKGDLEYDSLFDDPHYEPATEEETVTRVMAIARQLSEISGPGGNEQAARLAWMAGQYAGAGQVTIQRVVDILRAPILAWESATGQTSTWHKTIESQVRKGAEKPRAWTAAKRKEEDEAKAKAAAKRDETAVRRVLEFGDATISEVIAEDVLRGKYLRTRGLGWMHWTGKYWKSCDDGAPIEATRKYVKKMFIASIRQDGIGSSDAKGWATYNSAGKISAVVGLASNMDGVLREADELDAHPDLLNTPNGVVNVLRGEVGEHDPGLLLTKITRGNYLPGAKSDALETLLSAVPEDSLAWLQVHMGQGVSGRPKPRVPAVLLTGGGRNGKTLLTETVLHCLGRLDVTGYGVQVPPELLLMSKASGGPSPEKLLLRGARFAYVEETPEGRYLDVQALKKVVGTGVISGRDMYKPLVTFMMSHILFINTNHPPRVTETDSATWDRLTALRFPFRYRKANDDLGAWLDTDRPGDSQLSARLQEQETLDAVLTWLIDGYRTGAPEDVARPESVAASVSEWRHEGDMTLRFIEEVFEYDEGAWVTAAGVYSALQRWCEVNGLQKPPPSSTFMSRLKGHTGLGRTIAHRKVHSDRAGLSLPNNAIWVIEGAAGRRPETLQTNGIIGLSWRRGISD